MEIPQERQMMKNVMHAAFATQPRWMELTPDSRETIIRRIERECFAAAIESCTADGIDRRFTEPRFVNRYMQECYRITSNVDSAFAHDTYLIEKLCNGDIDAYKVVSMSNYELCPAASQHERDEVELRRNIKIVEKVSREYTCHKCKRNETVIKKYQPRAADEDSTSSIKCVNCGYVWRR